MCQYTFYVGINVGNVFTVKHKILYAIVLPICQNLDVGIGIQKSKYKWLDILKYYIALEV